MNRIIVIALALTSLAQAATGPIEFREGSLKILTPNGDQKKVIVRVWPGAARVDVLYQDGTPYMGFTKEDFEKNEETSAVTYSYSKHHRTKTLVGTAIVFWPAAVVTVFRKSTHHWITIQSGSKLAPLRASKKNYMRLRSQVAAALGVLPVIADDQ